MKLIFNLCFQLLFNLATRPAITEEAVKLLAQKALLKPKAVVMPPSTDSVKPVSNTRNV